MLAIDLVLFLVSLVVLMKSAQYAVNYSSKLARAFGVSEFIVSFFVIAVISTFPEATVSIVSALNNVPEFGLGTLIGSNVADLSLVFGIIALFSTKGIQVKSEILKRDLFYLILLAVPVILGLDGNFSREDGILLILSSVIFFMTLATQSKAFKKKFNGAESHEWVGNLVLVIVSIGFLLLGAYYTMKFGVDLAQDMGIPPFLIALTVVSIGTCMPELMFSLKAVQTKHDQLALGDVLGTVILDATVFVGVLALINPFDFNPNIIRITGLTMFIAGAMVILMIRSERKITKIDGVCLILFYILSLILEIMLSR